MFFTPHADDIEFGTPFMYIESLRLGYRIIEVVMTNNEFGSHRDEFKGKRVIYYILSKTTIRGYTKFHNLTPEETGLR